MILSPRNATVYQDDQNKPSPGQALNVPSTIYLENSWPRARNSKQDSRDVRSGPLYDRHIARLKRINDTHFVSYDADTGVWCFKVDHFTTYGLDDEDDDDDMDVTNEMQAQSGSNFADTEQLAPGSSGSLSDDLLLDIADVDDTFHFKTSKLSSIRPPGGFDPYGTLVKHEMELPQGESVAEKPSAITESHSSGGAVRAPSPETMQRYHSSQWEEASLQDAMIEDEHDVPGAFIPEEKPLRSILKPSNQADAFASLMS